MLTFTRHPLSTIFGDLEPEELAKLCTDVQERGLLEPIYLYEDQVLDGWHRYQACVTVNIVPRTFEYTDDDPVGFVRAKNLLRRHRTESQRALVEVKLSAWRPAGRPANQLVHVNQLSSPTTSPPQRSAQEMATASHVGVSTIKRAKIVDTEGSQELNEAVLSGKVTVNEAVKEIRGTVFSAAELKQMATEAQVDVQDLKRTFKDADKPVPTLLEFTKIQDTGTEVPGPEYLAVQGELIGDLQAEFITQFREYMPEAVFERLKVAYWGQLSRYNSLRWMYERLLTRYNALVKGSDAEEPEHKRSKRAHILAS
jgi:hypothetical protein